MGAELTIIHTAVGDITFAVKNWAGPLFQVR